jgi:hypothetical protein
MELFGQVRCLAKQGEHFCLDRLPPRGGGKLVEDAEKSFITGTDTSTVALGPLAALMLVAQVPCHGSSIRAE